MVLSVCVCMCVCVGGWVGGGAPAWSQALAVPALSMVSCVVKVLEHTSSSVVSGSSPLSVSVTCVPSTCAGARGGRKARAGAGAGGGGARC